MIIRTTVHYRNGFVPGEEAQTVHHHFHAGATLPEALPALQTVYALSLNADTTWPDVWAPVASDNAEIRQIDFRRVATGQPTLELPMVPPRAGGSAAQSLPPQNAICITWRTPNQLGVLKPKGRSFLPYITTAVLRSNADARLAIAVRDALANRAFDWMQHCTAQGVPLVIPSTVSDLDVPEVEGVSVGDVVDTQRRRRNQLREEYVAGVE